MSKIDKNYKSIGPRSSMSNKHKKQKKTIPRHIIINLLKTSDKEKHSQKHPQKKNTLHTEKQRQWKTAKLSSDNNASKPEVIKHLL